MKSSFLASLFYVTSNKNNMYHYPYFPSSSDSWCKYNADIADNIQTYKPGPEKCLHGKTPNANESFNGTMRKRIPKNTFVTLLNLKFTEYDAVVQFNIGMKASALIYGKLLLLVYAS